MQRETGEASVTQQPGLTAKKTLRKLRDLTRDYLSAAQVHSACTQFGDEEGAAAANRIAEKLHPKLLRALEDADEVLK